MTKKTQAKPVTDMWDDRAVETFPCRCGCGRMVTRTAITPKAAYFNDGCKRRNTRLMDDMRRLKSVIAAYAPIYQHCPVASWCMILSLAKLILERREKGTAEV